MPTIQVKAMLIAPNESFTAHAVSLLPPTAQNPAGYHRLIGGGVEFGETCAEAIRREVREELGARISQLQFLGTVESVFAVNDRPGHEVVALYSGVLDPSPATTDARLTESDGTDVPVVWRSFDESSEALPLYPAAAVAYVHRLPRTATRWQERADTVAAYNAWAEDYAQAVSKISPDLWAHLERFAAGIGPGAHVLEIGSAAGRDASALEAAGLRVDRTDITPAFVELLRSTGHQARQLDPLRDDLGGPYDGIWANAVLLHLNRPEFAITLHRLHHAVRSDGRLFLSLKEGNGDGWSRHGTINAPRHFTFWTPAELAAVLEAAGWTVESLTVVEGGKTYEKWLFAQARRTS